jgi:DNA-binding NarL/FixJ family response regulator
MFVSPATVRAQVTLTYRELAAATRRQAIARARELELPDGQGPPDRKR